MTETRSPDEIRTEIADTRTELGNTVAALAAKTDVKASLDALMGGNPADLLGKAGQLASIAQQVAGGAGGGGGTAGQVTQVLGTVSAAVSAGVGKMAADKDDSHG